VEARRVNLEDEVGKAKQEEQIDPLGRVEKVLYLDIP
jgi:hypothetical protein